MVSRFFRFSFILINSSSAAQISPSRRRLIYRCKQRSIATLDQNMRSFYLLYLAIASRGTSSFRIHRFLCAFSSRRKRVSSALSMSIQDKEQSLKRQKVAVIGSGAVGSYYGARLWEAGHSVQFHMRGEHLAVSQQQGLNVTSIHGDIYIPPDRLQAFEDTTQMDNADWAIMALKSSSLQDIPELILPLLTSETRVLVIMNGLVEDDLIELLKKQAGQDLDAPLECCRALYGGMAFICSNRLAPGRVDHSYAGLLGAGIAESRTTQDSMDDQIAFDDLWRPSEVTTSFQTDLLRGRWEKNIWNLPFNGISVAMGGITVDHIVNDPGLRRLADMIMDETIAIANADLERRHGSEYIPLGQKEKDFMFNLSDTMGPYKTSTMLDLMNRRSMEVKYLFRKPLERAESLGINCPHLETLVAQIEYFQRLHNLF